MSRFLDLVIPIKADAKSQALAVIVKDGFRLESWLALQRVGTVYDARIFALEHPDSPPGGPVVYSTVILSTTYEGPPSPYQNAFWQILPSFFCLVAFAAKDSPFTLDDFSADQKSAFAACLEVILAADGTATPEEQAKIQQRFRETNAALSEALMQDEHALNAGTIQKTKFMLFTDWVNRHDRSYRIGSPTEPSAPDGRDLRIPPVGNQRSQFIKPDLPTLPFASP